MRLLLRSLFHVHQVLSDEGDVLHLRKEWARQLIRHQRALNLRSESYAKKLTNTRLDAAGMTIESLDVWWKLEC